MAGWDASETANQGEGKPRQKFNEKATGGRWRLCPERTKTNHSTDQIRFFLLFLPYPSLFANVPSLTSNSPSLFFLFLCHFLSTSFSSFASPPLLSFQFVPLFPYPLDRFSRLFLPLLLPFRLIFFTTRYSCLSLFLSFLPRCSPRLISFIKAIVPRFHRLFPLLIRSLLSRPVCSALLPSHGALSLVPLPAFN